MSSISCDLATLYELMHVARGQRLEEDAGMPEYELLVQLRAQHLRDLPLMPDPEDESISKRSWQARAS